MKLYILLPCTRAEFESPFLFCFDRNGNLCPCFLGSIISPVCIKHRSGTITWYRPLSKKCKVSQNFIIIYIQIYFFYIIFCIYIIYLLPIHIYIYTCMKCISHTIHTNPSPSRPVQWRTPARCLDTVCMEPFERGWKDPINTHYIRSIWAMKKPWLVGSYRELFQLYRDSKKPL